MESYVIGSGARTPNDPKLSDRRGWRDRCAAGERRRQEAAGVTAAPVRCSAWLGDFERRSERVSLGVERDNLMCPQRVKAVCITGLVAELDLENVVGENLDDCANLPGNKTQLWQVANESHGVEQMDVGSSGHIEVSIG